VEATPQVSPRWFAIANAVISTAAIGFLVWLVYFHRGSSSAGGDSVLPTCNALFNTTSAVLLWLARRAIIRGDRQRHQRLMYAAFGSSTLFLATYIYYHYSHGDTAFTGRGAIRVVYFALLISHVVLSIVVLPMIFTSFFLALTKRFAKHKRLSRWTWACWMYVSVTGVLVYVMLHVVQWPSASAVGRLTQ
jgi:putative membrane protein